MGMAWAGLAVTLACQPAAAADDAVITADKAADAALAKGDKLAANKWLDPDFSWIDSEGIMWAKPDALRAGLKPLVPAGDDTKIIEHKYGKSVVWIQWNQGSKYSARFWVKTSNGMEAAAHDRDCRNSQARFPNRRAYLRDSLQQPVQSRPVQAFVGRRKASLDEWQEQESSQENWEKHVADNMDQRVVSTYGGRHPPKRIELWG